MLQVVRDAAGVEVIQGPGGRELGQGRVLEDHILEKDPGQGQRNGRDPERGQGQGKGRDLPVGRGQGQEEDQDPGLKIEGWYKYFCLFNIF